MISGPSDYRVVTLGQNYPPHYRFLIHLPPKGPPSVLRPIIIIASHIYLAILASSYQFADTPSERSNKFLLHRGRCPYHQTPERPTPLTYIGSYPIPAQPQRPLTFAAVLCPGGATSFPTNTSIAPFAITLCDDISRVSSTISAVRSEHVLRIVARALSAIASVEHERNENSPASEIPLTDRLLSLSGIAGRIRLFQENLSYVGLLTLLSGLFFELTSRSIPSTTDSEPSDRPSR